ncbi:MAG: tyrosine-type recombinase/integrase [Lachnospiraceae bacterium]
MQQFDKNVSRVIEFLEHDNFSFSVIYNHKKCYRAFREYIYERNILYSSVIADEWINENTDSWNYRRRTSWHLCMAQLEDIYNLGYIHLDHLGSRTSAYALLSEKFKTELDDFILNDQPKTADDRYRISCSRFLLYLQNAGLQSVNQLTCELVMKFYEEDYHKSQRSKDAYEDLIRAMLYYFAKNDVIPLACALILNKLLINQVIVSNEKELSLFKSDDAYKITWQMVEQFVCELKNIKYSYTNIKAAINILTLLYIFLEMHHMLLSKELLWMWFEKVKPAKGSSWRQHRRSLYQFFIFLETGTVITTMTGDPLYVPSIDKLPEWFRRPLAAYLDLLIREGWQPATITMHRSSCVRLGKYLVGTDLDSVRKLTQDHLKDFNLTDKHSTPEGKMAYNCRIRSFLIYLYEEGLHTNPLLYKALPTISAPRTSIVQVLSEEDVKNIWDVNPDRLTSKELRDYAIVCIGLTMGFRASDIVSLTFDSINWKQSTISLIQQKTGKSITMPMPVKTGNVIYKYLRDGRPVSADKHIFILHEAPHSAIHRSVCGNALKRFRVNPVGSKQFHITRKTFATNLLESQTKIELISDSLGHSTDSTVYKYLSLDEGRMRECPISMADVGISLKGGALHV